MAKRSRRTTTRSPNEGAARQTGPRNAAPSKSVSNMASSFGRSRPQQSKVSFEPRRQSPAKTRPQRRAVPSSQALFGTWELPTPQRPRARASEAVSTCAARQTRREVIFATRSTGAGSYARKLHFTNRKCK